MIDQPVSAPIPVHEFCDESAAAVTTLKKGETVKVISSLAGGTQTCFKVRLTRDGSTIEGYVIGPVLAEIEAYQKARQTDLRAGRFVQPAPARIEPAKEPAKDPEAAAKPEAAPPPKPQKPVPTVPTSKVG